MQTKRWFYLARDWSSSCLASTILKLAYLQHCLEASSSCVAHTAYDHFVINKGITERKEILRNTLNDYPYPVVNVGVVFSWNRD